MDSRPTSWEPYASEEGRYSVSFPGKPETMIQTHIDETMTPPVVIHLHIQWYQPVPGTRYDLHWYDPPWGVDDVREGAAALQNMAALGYDTEGAESSKLIEVDGVPGIEISWKDTRGISRKRGFLVDGRIIWQSYEGPVDTENSADVETFFSSLKLSLKVEREIHG